MPNKQRKKPTYMQKENPHIFKTSVKNIGCVPNTQGPRAAQLPLWTLPMQPGTDTRPSRTTKKASQSS